MRSVWKFSFAVDGTYQSAAMPKGSRVVHVASQYGEPGSVQLWVEVDPEAPIVTRQFAVIGTGHATPLFHEYVGTAVCAGGQLVWHVYEDTAP